MTSLKEQLEDKDCEVKRLQERLVCKTKGEGADVLDRGETDGLALASSLWEGPVGYRRGAVGAQQNDSPSDVWVQ